MVNQPQYCPAAVVYCCMHGGVGRSKNNDSKGSEMRLKARNHLLALNWKLWYAQKGGYKQEIRYTSPNQKTFYSLRTACRSLIDEQCSQNLTLNLNANPAVNLHAKAESESMDFGDLGQEENHARHAKRACRFDEGSQNLTHNLRANLEEKSVMVTPQTSQSSSDDALHSRKRRKKNTEVNLHAKAEAESMDFGNLGQEDDNARRAKPGRRRGKEKRKGIANSMTSRDDQKKSAVKHTHVRISGKQERQKVLPRFSVCNPRAVVLSKLIENNVVFPGAKVCYGGKKGRVPLAKGSITNGGIKCNCCNEVFTLTGFEVHAGSKNHRPAANIFLEDGRSLVDCLRHMVSTDNTAIVKGSNRMKSNSHQFETYDMCVVCLDGGELICCDHCPCMYHSSCLGLKDIPYGDWFCPLCCCAICGDGKFKQRTLHSVDDDDGLVRTCDQCEHKFHTGCTRKSKRELKVKSQNKWFCSDRCEHVFSSLHELIGKPFSISENNLNWRLLKSLESDHQDVSNSTDGKFLKELQRKLHGAVEVMHECFEPAKEPLTGRDLIEDVIFNRRSELKHLNYVGFYTVVLEKKRKIISAATVRVYEKVAEIPFVATMFKYRRNGMCRLLMAELEKQLIALGVERLVLPSAPSVLNAWTTKFGFSKMTASERLNYLNYTFLDFQGTIMCQKFLMKTPSASPCLSQAA